jgi:hypothetical protein
MPGGVTWTNKTFEGNHAMKLNTETPLRNLPPIWQEEIMSWLESGGRSEECTAWLVQEGLETCEGSLRKFRHWYGLRRDFWDNGKGVGILLEAVKRTEPGMTAEQLEAMGQEFFSQLVMKRQDTKQWYLVQRLHFARAIKKESDETRDDAVLTSDERERRIHEILGMP